VAQLLDQLQALGETARQLKQTLGSNGHKTEAVAEIKELQEIKESLPCEVSK